MKKIFAIAVILALFVFGLTVGASAAEPTTTGIIDLAAENAPTSGTGWTWTENGTTGTLITA